jgi:thymidylate synthase (FAD)
MITIQPGFIIESEVNGKEILKHIEKVGRTCYKSEDKITEESAEKFVKGIISRGHEAMIEHASITVRFTCDRGVSHEAVRHRIASFAQESTRYCNYSQDKFGSEITVIDIEGGIKFDTKMKSLSPESIIKIIEEWKVAMLDAERHYLRMIKLGATPQIARGVLPNSLKTEIVITANLREWRNIFKLRTDIAAHPQIREIMIPLLNQLKTLIPVIFDDIEVV